MIYNYGHSQYEPNYIPQQSSSPPMFYNNQPNNQDKYQYSQNILEANVGKKAKIHMSFPDSIEWRDKIFSGTIEKAGADYLLIKENKNPFLLQTVYINFIEFTEDINY